jgi:hypothetical protein
VNQSGCIGILVGGRDYCVVIALDANATAIIVAPMDYTIWNERSAAAATDIAKTLQLQPGGNTFQLWVTHVSSPRFKQEAQAFGVTQGAEKLLAAINKIHGKT